MPTDRVWSGRCGKDGYATSPMDLDISYRICEECSGSGEVRREIRFERPPAVYNRNGKTHRLRVRAEPTLIAIRCDKCLHGLVPEYCYEDEKGYKMKWFLKATSLDDLSD